MLSTSTIRGILGTYKLANEKPLCQQISAYIDLLLKWNRKISLTSVEEPTEIVRYHFAESFLGAKVAGIREGRLADVGTGAGFPGLAFKLYVPALKVTLIESNVKKCAFLAEIVRVLELADVEIIRSRFEEIQLLGEIDFVATRAIGEIQEFLAWAARSTRAEGKAILWVGPEGVQKAISATENWVWGAPQPIPLTKRRFILVGTRQLDR